MKIVVIGTRGIPDIPGGVETHCQKLFPRLVAMGCDVTVVRRSCYVKDDDYRSEYEGVKLKDIYAPKRKSLEAIVHTFLGVIYAKKQKADILHIQAIGPALLTPFARLLGMRVVVTHHGADYERQKWGKMAKLILKTGERFAAKYANDIISISNVITES
ncbi:MAG: glycosyltransferase, partial [Dysgonomonas sp.]